MRRLLLATLMSLAAAGASVSQAALTIYTDQTLFLAAANGPVVQDFSGIALPNEFVSLGGSVIGGITYGTPTNMLGVVDAGFDPEYDYGTGAVLLIPVGDETTTLSFNSTISVGFMLGTYADPEGTVTVTVAGEVFEIYTGAFTGNLQFIGFISDTPFTSVEFGTFDTYGAIIDNFAVAIPEPLSLMLFGSGLLALGAARPRLA